MAGRNKPGSGGFDSPDKVNSNTLKRHPKMDLSRTDLLQLLSYLEGELQARDITIATLKAEKAKQLLYQAKYGRFGLGDPFSAMQRDSDSLKDNTFDESAIKSMYDNQLAQLENLIATQRKAQMKMREQMIAGDKRYQKVCTELDDEKRKHAQDTAQGDDVTYMLEKERERLKQEVDFEKANTKKMEKDLKKTLASLEEERAGSAKHKQVALMLIKERKKLVEKFVTEKKKADHMEKALGEERTKSMNMAEGLVQESKKSLKMEATMERQLSEFDLEREQMKNKLLREENRTKDLQGQIETLRNHLDSLQKQGKLPKDAVHSSVEIKSVGVPPGRLSSERQVWSSSGSITNTVTGKSGQLKTFGEAAGVEHEAGLSPRNSPSADLSVRKRDNTRYASPQPVERGVAQYGDSLEQRVAPVGAVSDKSLNDGTQGGHKLGMSAPSVVSGGGRITVQTGSPTPGAGPVSPRRGISVGRGVPPPIPPNKPVLPVATISKPASVQQKVGSTVTKDSHVSQQVTKPVHIPVSVVHTSSVSTAAGSRTPKREGSPSTMRKPAQLFSDLPASGSPPTDSATTATCATTATTPPTPDSFDFLGPEMADLQQLLVSMVTGPADPACVESSMSASSSSSQLSSVSPSPSTPHFTSTIAVVQPKPSAGVPASRIPSYSTVSTLASSLSSVDSPALHIRELSDVSSSLVLNSSSSSSSGWPVSSGTAMTQSPGLAVNKSAPVFSTQSLSPGNVTPEQSHFVPYSRKASGKTSPVKEMPTSPIHRYAASGNVESLRKLIIDLEADVNLPMKDGTTPTHCAAENGHTECLQLLLEKGCNVNCLRDDQMSPVHCAAAEGHTQCLLLLLQHGGSVQLADNSGWTPLHWAASRGHLHACTLLLQYGASNAALSNTNSTPWHLVVQCGSASCLELMLTSAAPDQGEVRLAGIQDKDGLTDSTNSTPCHLAVQCGSARCLELMLTSAPPDPGEDRVAGIQDKDGWTIAHLAACRDDTDCLCVVLASCDIDLACQEKLGRTVLDVSSTNCHQLLLPYLNRERLKRVQVELCCTGLSFTQQQPYIIGSISVLPNMDWHAVDTATVDLVQAYFTQLDTGLRTKKTSRLDPDTAAGESGQFTLGLTGDSIHSYMVGSYRWIRNEVFPDVLPQDMMSNNNAATISVFLKGTRDDHQSMAFDLLLPLASINNYVRLLEQYRSVVFYGPEGTRKKQLVKRLANHLVEKERAHCEPHVIQIYLHRDYTHRDFQHLLKTEGCMLPAGVSTNVSCMLLLFHLEKVQLAAMLGPLLEHIEYRGMQHAFPVLGPNGVAESYYFPENFYFIATMDKPRSTGLDLSVQQRFRWVHFRITEEPVRHLLARHFLRRLLHAYSGQLAQDDPVFKAVEWLVCVWQRLNDGVAKLGLPDVVFGPDLFLSCPLESRDQNAVFEWLKRLWNESLAPVVRHAVSQGTRQEKAGMPGGGARERQNKVANTALYVLMQRAVVPGFPLSGEEKERYLLEFSGSNELDVPMKVEKQSPSGGGGGGGVPPTRRSMYSSRGDSPSNLTSMKALTKQRNSLGGEGSTTPLFVNGNSTTSVKRRSLSDPALARTEQVEIPIIHDPGNHGNQSPGDLQAKVPKLEIRSPVLGLPIPLPNAFTSGKSNSPESSNTERSTHRRSTFSSHSRIPQSTAKRSRSSENLSVPAGNVYNNGRQFRPTSPFSFSLTTPTSSLFSFKFMDDASNKPAQVTNSYHKRSFSEKR